MTRFAKTCAEIPDYGFYFFRRCDFSVFDQKRLPVFEDGFVLIPEQLGQDIQKTDDLLSKFRYKRELFVGDGTAGYRVRYQKSAGKITYWSRIRVWSSIEHSHNLRWDFDGDLTDRLFKHLTSIQSGLPDEIFKGIKQCAHCYEICGARKKLSFRGQVYEVCQDDGWETIGETHSDFENLHLVLIGLNELT